MTANIGIFRKQLQIWEAHNGFHFHILIEKFAGFHREIYCSIRNNMKFIISATHMQA
jgi:hypothetical protein